MTTKAERAELRKGIGRAGRTELLKLLEDAWCELDEIDDTAAAREPVVAVLKAPGVTDCKCGAIEMFREISAVIGDVKHTRTLCGRFVPFPVGKEQPSEVQAEPALSAQTERGLAARVESSRGSAYSEPVAHTPSGERRDG